MTPDELRACIERNLTQLGSEHEPPEGWQDRAIADAPRPSWWRRAWRWLWR